MKLAKTASFTVRLRSQPTDNITIYVASSDTSEGTVSADNLSFTTTRLERGPDGDDHRRCGQSFRRRPVLRDPSAGG